MSGNNVETLDLGPTPSLIYLLASGNNLKFLNLEDLERSVIYDQTEKELGGILDTAIENARRWRSRRSLLGAMVGIGAK